MKRGVHRIELKEVYKQEVSYSRTSVFLRKPIYKWIRISNNQCNNSS